MSGISQADAFDMLARRLEHARKEHPVFAHTMVQAVYVVNDETLEMIDALDQSTARVLDEALDVAATAMRLVMGEVRG